MSSIGWIDFSSEHRDKVRTAIDLLSAPGVVDELGIGVVRDSFADRMFPGVSTVQTRAKYFTLTALLIEYYQIEELKKRKPRTLEQYLEEEEKHCRIDLVKRHGSGRNSLGIIGGTFGKSADRDVIRRPSSIYWNGLRLFGFVSPKHLSLAEFSRRISYERRQMSALLEETTKERGDDHDADQDSMRIRVRTPEVPDNYREELSIDLSPEEAQFLHDQITLNQRDSLLGQILAHQPFSDQVLKLSGSATFREFSELPFIDELKSDELKRTVHHAHDFWLIMEGAHIRYNCLLQDQGFGTSERKAEFEEMWQDWRARIRPFPARWDSAFMWAVINQHGSQVQEYTRNFIDGWIVETQQGAGGIERCNELVRRQEQRNKRKRARLRAGNQEAVRSWIGLDRIEYRIPQVIQIVKDIHAGLNKGG